MDQLLALLALGIGIYLYIKYPPVSSLQRKWNIALIIVIAIIFLRLLGLWQPFILFAAVAAAVIIGVHLYNVWKDSKKPPTLS